MTDVIKASTLQPPLAGSMSAVAMLRQVSAPS
jgi:hypothetical protein